MILEPKTDYDSLIRSFVWRIPERFNIAAACCDVWAARDPDRPAILDATDGGHVVTTFSQLRDRADRLANSLASRGLGRGDRIAIMLPQSADVVASHLASYKLGAIALPLASLFGVDALAYRLADSGARVLITDASGAGKLKTIRHTLPALEFVLCTQGPDGGALDFEQLVAAASPYFATADTSRDDQGSPPP